MCDVPWSKFTAFIKFSKGSETPSRFKTTVLDRGPLMQLKDIRVKEGFFFTLTQHFLEVHADRRLQPSSCFFFIKTKAIVGDVWVRDRFHQDKLTVFLSPLPGSHCWSLSSPEWHSAWPWTSAELGFSVCSSALSVTFHWLHDLGQINTSLSYILTLSNGENNIFLSRLM